MNTQRPNKNYKTPPKDHQLVVLLYNSKYTHADFTEFHSTVINILDNNSLSHLTESQKKNALFFIDIVVRLIDTPRIPSLEKPKENRNKPNQDLDLLESTRLKFGSITEAIDQYTEHAASRENLNKLLNWIEQLVQRKQITIEAILDEFFLLNLVKA